MIANALIRRYAVSVLRPRHLWVNCVIFAIGLTVIGTLNMLALRYGTAFRGDVRLCYRSMYGQLLALQFLLLWVWGGYNAGSALREEMLRKSYDFFQLLPLSSWQKLVGVAIGRNLSALALSAVTAVVQLVLGGLGGVPLWLQVHVSFALVATTAALWFLVVHSSIRPRRGRAQRGPSVLLLIFLSFLVIPAVMHFVMLVISIAELDGWTILFFASDVPGLLFIGAIAAYLAVWTAFGAMRRLEQADQTLFSRMGAYRFLVGGMLIILGLFWSALSEAEPESWFWYSIVTYGLIALIPFGVSRTWEQYLEWTYSHLTSAQQDQTSSTRRFLAASNPVAWMGLYLLWAVGVVLVAAIQSVSMVPWALVLVGSVFAPWLVLLLVMELAVVGTQHNEKMKLFAAFLGLLYLILPPLVGSVLDRPGLFPFWYFGIWGSVSERAFRGVTSGISLIWPVLVNGLIAGVLATVIHVNYLGLLHARRDMLKR